MHDFNLMGGFSPTKLDAKSWFSNIKSVGYNTSISYKMILLEISDLQIIYFTGIA